MSLDEFQKGPPLNFFLRPLWTGISTASSMVRPRLYMRLFKQAMDILYLSETSFKVSGAICPDRQYFTVPFLCLPASVRLPQRQLLGPHGFDRSSR